MAKQRSGVVVVVAGLMGDVCQPVIWFHERSGSEVSIAVLEQNGIGPLASFTNFLLNGRFSDLPLMTFLVVVVEMPRKWKCPAIDTNLTFC